MAVTVSIIVPCYHVASYVDACMESLVNQSLRDMEIICVNDGSTDATPELLEAWVRKDSRIRVVNQENGGLSAARNTGMDLARGEYIGFVDPDDYVEHSMYARLLEEARRSDADVTACGYTGFSDRDGSVLERWSLSPAEGVEEDMQSRVFQENTVWGRMAVMAWNKLYKREFLERKGLRFEPRFRQGEDDVFWLMLLSHVKRLAVIPDRLYWYRRQREGALSHEWEEQGCPFTLDAERLVHAAAYWKKTGWLDSGLERGWVLHFLWYYLLLRLVPTHIPLPVLSAEEWGKLHEGTGRLFSLVGGADRLQGLDKWEMAFCRLLGRSPERFVWLRRLWWKRLSLRRGRRGRYYALRLLLASGAEKKHH